MAPPMQIPGYYYDEEKRRYFKIERNATAPASAAWSDRNVKKRKAEAAEAAAAKKAAVAAAAGVRRAPALADPVVGGLLRRELNGLGSSSGLADADVPQIAWAAGLQDKGAVKFPSRVETFITISEERLGLGLFYAVCSNNSRHGPHPPRRRLPVYSNYFYRDQYDHIQTSPAFNPSLSRFCSQHTETFHAPGNPSAIAWDPREESIILTSSCGGPNNAPGLKCLLRRRQGTDNGKPCWLLGSSACAYDIGPLPPVWACAVSAAAKGGGVGGGAGSRARHPSAMAMGTERGVYVMDAGIKCISAPHLGSSSPSSSSAHLPGREVFALDFVGDHQKVLAVGGRGPAGICVADLRENYRCRQDLTTTAEAVCGDARVDAGGSRGTAAAAAAATVVTTLGALPRKTVLYSDGSRIPRSSDRGPRVAAGREQPQTALLCHPGHHDARYGGLVFPEHLALVVPHVGQLRGVRWLQAAREPVVSHLVSLNQYQILSAGIEGRMHVWDLRRPGGVPYTTFPAYKNKATAHNLGLAVSKPLGLVAAANDDGSVRLHSLRSGAPLASPVLDRMLPPAPASSSSSSSPSPCPRLQWAALPGEDDAAPSLFVARGAEIRKFSFGVDSRLRGDEFSVEDA